MIRYTQQIEIADVAGGYRVIIDARDVLNGDVPEIRLVGPDISPMYFTVQQANELGIALRNAVKTAAGLNVGAPMLERIASSGDGDPACGYPLPHPAHDFANPDEERDGEFGPTQQCAGVGGDSDAPR